MPRDYESHVWSLGEDSWDLIHVQQACGSVSSWPELYQKIYQYALHRPGNRAYELSRLTCSRHLKPGAGWIEQVEIDLEPRCDDGTLQRDSFLVQWYNYLADATYRAERPIGYQHNTRQMLQAAGFIDIQETIVRAPLNGWPSDPHQKSIGRW